MNKSVIVGLVVAVVVLAGGGTYLALHKSTNKTTSTTMNMPTSTSKTTDTVAKTNSVTLDNFAFSPANITVKKGTTVTWTNKDSANHTITQDVGTPAGSPGLDSKVLDKGETYSATFAATGTFKYHCSLHPTMVGSVTVTE